MLVGLLRAAEKYDIASLFGTIFKKEPYFNNEKKRLRRVQCCKKSAVVKMYQNRHFQKTRGKRGNHGVAARDFEITQQDLCQKKLRC